MTLNFLVYLLPLSRCSRKTGGPFCPLLIFLHRHFLIKQRLLNADLRRGKLCFIFNCSLLLHNFRALDFLTQDERDVGLGFENSVKQSTFRLNGPRYGAGPSDTKIL
jgi:hypothetical protein